MSIPTLWRTGGMKLQMAQIATLTGEAMEASAGVAVPWREFYRMLRLYAEGNGVYEQLVHDLRSAGAAQDDIRAIRNPANRVVKFYTANLWRGQLPGAMPIESENEDLEQAIHQLWMWSNWSSQKQVTARWLATYGDGFVRVATREDDAGGVTSVYLQNMDPTNVTDYARDERGFLTYIRTDVPMVDDDGRYWHTEVWDLDALRIWRNERGPGVEIEDLGTPSSTTTLDEMGIDFIPISHFRFEDTGAERGVGAFTSVLDKIDEANQKATRLSQMMYRHNKALWALSANNVDASGRPTAPPSLSDEVSLEDDSILRLPGMSTLTPLVPSLPFDAALNDLRAMMDEIGEDLPELAYFSLRNRDVSGVAARTMLGDAIALADTVRGNATDGLVRAHKMAVTIGQYHELFEQGIGSYDAGDLDHVLAIPDPFKPGWGEIAETVQTLTTAGVPVLAALEMAGADEYTIELVRTELSADQIRDIDLASAYINEAEAQASRTQGFTFNGA